MSDFEAATAVTPNGDGFRGTVHPDWSIAGRTNGGYLVAMLARAALAAAGSASNGNHPHPVATSTAFIAPAPAGDIMLIPQVHRAGRLTTVVRVLAIAGGQPCAESLVTCGRLDVAADGGPWHDQEQVPAMPDERDCPRLPVDSPGLHVPLMGVVEERLDPATLGWAAGAPSGRGELRGYLRLADGTDPDTLSLLLAVDALPPATFDLGVAGWAPTLQLSVWVRALPAPGALVVRPRARHGAGAFVDESCDVWDSTGRLVASSHQLAGVRR